MPDEEKRPGPFWERMPSERIAEMEVSLRDLEERAARQRSDWEMTAVILELTAGPEVGDQARLVASQVGHLISRLTDARADMRARLRSDA